MSSQQLVKSFTPHSHQKLSCLKSGVSYSSTVSLPIGMVGAILIGFWYILFRRFPPNICESFNLCSFMQTDFQQQHHVSIFSQIISGKYQF